MAKKNTKPETGNQLVDVSKCPNVRTFEFEPEDKAAATALGIVLSGSATDRVSRAIMSSNQALRLIVEAGYLLMSVRAELPHGSFLDGIESMGLSRQRASEMMSMAKLMTRLPEEQRSTLLSLHKTKALALANADPDVVDVLLLDDDGTIDLSTLGVRELRAKLRELEAANTDLAVQRDAANAELATARKKLEAPEDRKDSVPVVIADLRSEVVALGKKASLAVDGFNPLGRDIANLRGTESAHMWADATLRLALAQLASVGMQIEGLIKSFKDALGDEEVSATEMSFLTNQEVVEAAQKFKELIAEHDHEAALRAWEREQERPRDKGRPRSKPEAPIKSRKG